MMFQIYRGSRKGGLISELESWVLTFSRVEE